MAGSDANSIPTGSPPRSCQPCTWCRIIDVSTPRRRCVAFTVIIVTPAAGTVVPPGTVSSNGRSPPVLISSSPSNAATVRSRGSTAIHRSWVSCGGEC
ncbi:MAG: hypothetical protein AUG49_06995 [Catenulispora sp. 13_1_20CM_3_70_7]|nr:MAG: hypothetical protein AUG49_06995 [Catenulispora sp. 13_1_20CM_3_70_7]